MRGKSEWRQAKVAATEQIAGDVRRIAFAMEGPLPRFEAGAHTEIRVTTPHGPTTRSYTCVPAAPGQIAVAVKTHENSRGGSRFMWSLSPGDAVEVMVPENRFELSYSAPHYLLMAGGIGVTPIYGMARTLVRRGASVRMVYGARSRAVMAYANELSTLLGDRLSLYESDKGEHIDIAAEIAALPESAELYLCGPIGMLNAVRAAWTEAGRSPGRLRYEVFGDSGTHAEQPFVAEVPALGVGVEVAADESLLEALATAGVDMISDCERGECGLCVVGIIGHEGEIDHRDVFLSDAEKAEGKKMCACVSRIAGGRVTIDVGYRGEVSRVAAE